MSLVRDYAALIILKLSVHILWQFPENVHIQNSFFDNKWSRTKRKIFNNYQL